MLLEPQSWCFPFFCKITPTLSLLHFRSNIFILSLLFLFMDLFSEVEEVMEGVAPVEQSPQKRPKGPCTDSTSTIPYSYDVSSPSSPCSSSVVPTFDSPSVVPSITTPPDSPIKVEYLSDCIPVPSPLFPLQRYSASISTPGSSSISTYPQCCQQSCFSLPL